MNFLSEYHKQTFEEFSFLAQAKPREKEYRAALYLLSSPLLARRTKKYIEPRGIRFEDLKETAKPWSSSERALLSLAGNLFNGSWPADINEVFWNLDQGNTEIAIQAIRLRFE